MYGPRPQPPSLQQQVDKALDFAQSTKDKFTMGEPNPKPPDVQSAWLARMLLYATIEANPNPKLQRLPLIMNKPPPGWQELATRGATCGAVPAALARRVPKATDGAALLAVSSSSDGAPSFHRQIAARGH